MPTSTENKMAVCQHCSATRTNPFTRVRVKDGTDDKHVRVLVTFDGVPCCDETVDEYLGLVSDVYDRDVSFVMMYDARNIGIPTSGMMAKQAGFMRLRDADTTRLMVRCAIVTDSMIVKTMLDGLFLLKPPATDLRVFATMKEAKTFLTIHK
jgi:hypothetical protein